MPEPIIEIKTIVRDAREACDMGIPISDCPYPSDWEAADRWRAAHEARNLELKLMARLIAMASWGNHKGLTAWCAPISSAS